MCHFWAEASEPHGIYPFFFSFAMATEDFPDSGFPINLGLDMRKMLQSALECEVHVETSLPCLSH
jgi:hypothetical protein